jgi:DNA polymerase III subunit delta'
VARFETRGHAAALAVVARAIASQRPPHALLLSGPAGVGKTTLALDLAAGILCTASDVGDRPCRECAACRRVASGNHPDLHRIAPDGAGGQVRLGQVQALAADLALLPLEGTFRVAIVEQAQRLNLDAQHAMLKTLEEPPARVVLVLAADEPSGLLPTVISRCARLRMGSVSPDVIADLLVERGIADAVRGTVLGRLSGGRPGVAMTLAADPELVLAHGRLSRALLDLLRVARHARLAAATDLLADGRTVALLESRSPVSLPRASSAPSASRSVAAASRA